MSLPKQQSGPAHVGKVINMTPEQIAGGSVPRWSDAVADLGSERALIAYIVRRPDEFAQVAHRLSPRDFYDRLNGFAWLAFEQLTGKGEPISMVSVAGMLRQQEYLQKSMPGADWDMVVAAYLEVEDRPDMLDRYIANIEDAALRVRLGDSAEQIKTLAADPTVAVDRLVEQAEGTVYSVTQRREPGGPSLLSDRLEAWVQEWTMGERDTRRPVTTGNQKLDTLLGGSERKEITILAGWQGSGKTTWMLSGIYNQISQKLRGALFSQEMRGQQEILAGLLQIKVGIHRKAIRRFDIPEKRYDDFMTATLNMREMVGNRLAIVDDEHPLTPTRLRTRLRRIEAEMGKLDFVWIDGIWLCQAEAPEARPDRPDLRLLKARFEINQYLVEEFIAVANDFDVAMFVTAQMNTDIYARQRKEPMLSDLSQGSGIRMTAQTILALHRPAIFDADNTHDLSEIWILKDRGGEGTGQKVAFDYDPSRNYYHEGVMTDVNLRGERD